MITDGNNQVLLDGPEVGRNRKRKYEWVDKPGASFGELCKVVLQWRTAACNP